MSSQNWWSVSGVFALEIMALSCGLEHESMSSGTAGGGGGGSDGGGDNGGGLPGCGGDGGVDGDAWHTSLTGRRLRPPTASMPLVPLSSASSFPSQSAPMRQPASP
jgi:hypothetical protein